MHDLFRPADNQSALVLCKSWLRLDGAPGLWDCELRCGGVLWMKKSIRSGECG